MRAVPKIGFRREVLILVPATLLVVFILAVFTLRSYRNAVEMFGEEARIEALDAARVAASRLARERAGALWPPSPERLEALVPNAVSVSPGGPRGSVDLGRGRAAARSADAARWPAWFRSPRRSRWGRAAKRPTA